MHKEKQPRRRSEKRSRFGRLTAAMMCRSRSPCRRTSLPWLNAIGGDMFVVHKKY